MDCSEVKLGLVELVVVEERGPLPARRRRGRSLHEDRATPPRPPPLPAPPRTAPTAATRESRIGVARARSARAPSPPAARRRRRHHPFLVRSGDRDGVCRRTRAVRPTRPGCVPRPGRGWGTSEVGGARGRRRRAGTGHALALGAAGERANRGSARRCGTGARERERRGVGGAGNRAELRSMNCEGDTRHRPPATPPPPTPPPTRPPHCSPTAAPHPERGLGDDSRKRAATRSEARPPRSPSDRWRPPRRRRRRRHRRSRGLSRGATRGDLAVLQVAGGHRATVQRGAPHAAVHAGCSARPSAVTARFDPARGSAANTSAEVGAAGRSLAALVLRSPPSPAPSPARSATAALRSAVRRSLLPFRGRGARGVAGERRAASPPHSAPPPWLACSELADRGVRRLPLRDSLACTA